MTFNHDAAFFAPLHSQERMYEQADLLQKEADDLAYKTLESYLLSGDLPDWASRLPGYCEAEAAMFGCETWLEMVRMGVDIDAVKDEIQEALTEDAAEHIKSLAY